MIDQHISQDDYLKGIVKAKEGLSSLADKINGNKIDPNVELWIGADIIICMVPPAEQIVDSWGSDEYVVNPYAKELTWLFYALRDIF